MNGNLGLIGMKESNCVILFLCTTANTWDSHSMEEPRVTANLASCQNMDQSWPHKFLFFQSNGFGLL